jgi:hypothetical protein
LPARAPLFAFAIRATGALLATLLPLAAQALPMGSKESWMVMGDFSEKSQELAANWAVTTRDALGASAGRWKEDAAAGGEQRYDFGAFTYTRRLHRWNLEHAQSNLWFVGSAGALRPSGVAPGAPKTAKEALWSAAAMADYETTRIYFGATARTQRGERARKDDTYARAGFSFFVAEYDEVQPWLIGEVRRERDSLGKTDTTVTAMLRLISRGYFVEFGGNRDGAVLNFMLNY